MVRQNLMKELMPNVGLADLDLFLRVAKLKSLRECARQLDMTPGAVSKAIKRLEQKVQKNLLRRSVSGILLTSDGHDLMEIAEKVLDLTSTLSPELAKKNSTEKVWGIGSLSFISSRLLPQILDSVVNQPKLNSTNRKNDNSKPSTIRFRIVEFSHNQLVAYGLNGAFEMAVHIGPLEWTRVWSSHELGNLRWCLYAKADHPLAKMKTVRSADVVQFPFVMPMGWGAQGFVRGEDHCPVPWGARFLGHEATTGETALEIAAHTAQLVFIPSILGERSVNSGLVKEIKVVDWPNVQRKIFLSVRDDLVSANLLRQVIELIQTRLSV